jgi:hypothetical protein
LNSGIVCRAVRFQFKYGKEIKGRGRKEGKEEIRKWVEAMNEWKKKGETWSGM